jgi:hypothetical protein
MPVRLLEIAEPCPAAWGGMTGTGARRHCGQCRKTVHHLSAMDPAAATELLAGAAPDGICVRVRCDAEGFVIHDAPPTPRSAPRRLRLLSPAVLAAMAACSAGESDLPLVVEGPGFPASSVQRENSSDRALGEALAVKAPADGTPSAERAIPARQTRAREHDAQQAPTLPTSHFMGLTVVREPVRPATQKPMPKAPSDQHGHTDSEFDFGI